MIRATNNLGTLDQQNIGLNSVSRLIENHFLVAAEYQMTRVQALE